MTKEYCVYILKGDRFYVGMTGNLEQRIKQHKDGICHTTKRIGKFSIKKIIHCKSKAEAAILERKIKRGGHPERWIKKTSVEFPPFMDTITPT